MSAPELITAAKVRPCIGKNVTDATGITGALFRTDLNIAVAIQTVSIPASVRGMWIDLIARGCAVQYAFVLDGTTKPTLTFNAIAVAGTGSTNGAAGETVLQDERLPVEIPKNAKELVFIWGATTAGAFFEGTVKSQRA